MLKLMSISTQQMDLNRFEKDYNNIKKFLTKHQMQGLEIIQHSPWDPKVIPSPLLIGLHMSFWPMWLDFWRGDEKELLRQFGDGDTYKHYYGGKSKTTMIEHYRNELKTANEMGVEYVVFHVSHVELDHCYNYKFNYDDNDVVEAFIEMINSVTEGLDIKFELLFENLWWPGLTLLDKDVAERLMQEIKYKNKGFMLDIGHMMNTCTELKCEEEAVEYIIRILENLGETSGYIHGIHLNSTLSGEYVKKQIQDNPCPNPKEAFFDRYMKACRHIAQVDNHKPFINESIKKVIDFVTPKYLVYEFFADSLEKLDGYIELQNRVIE